MACVTRLVLKFGLIKPSQWTRHLIINRMTMVNSKLRKEAQTFDYDTLYTHYKAQFVSKQWAHVKRSIWLKIIEPLKGYIHIFSVVIYIHID